MKSTPSLVVIASTMRSGSTLLKALLAEADDVLNLPETNFQNDRVVQRVLQNHKPTDPPIKLLKKPAWYQESRSYPRLPSGDDVKVVALVRDVYDTVVSLRKMTFRGMAGWFAPMVTSWMARRYWVNVTRSLLDLSKSRPHQVRLVRYEDLTADPVQVTSDLYSFVGSNRTEGTRTYSPPDSYKWKWGSDDGSQNIKSLEVQAPREKIRDEARLNRVIEGDPQIIELRTRLNYCS